MSATPVSAPFGVSVLIRRPGSEGALQDGAAFVPGENLSVSLQFAFDPPGRLRGRLGLHFRASGGALFFNQTICASTATNFRDVAAASIPLTTPLRSVSPIEVWIGGARNFGAVYVTPKLKLLPA